MHGIREVFFNIRLCISRYKQVWWFEFRNVVLSYKWLILSIISYMLIDLYMQDIKLFADTYNLGVYPAALAFFFEDSTFCNIGMLALIFVMSTFPVTNKLQQGVLLRSGRTAWAIGQMGTVVTIAFLWLAEMMVFTCISIGEHLDFTGWGQVWGSFSKGAAMEGATVITVSKRVIMGFKPWEAVLLSSMYVALTGSIYGLIIFCVDGITKTHIGEIVLAIWSSAWIVIGNFEFMAENKYVKMLSPRNWLNLDKYIGDPNEVYKNIGIMLVIISVLWMFGILLVKKQRIVPE